VPLDSVADRQRELHGYRSLLPAGVAGDYQESPCIASSSPVTYTLTRTVNGATSTVATGLSSITAADNTAPAGTTITYRVRGTACNRCGRTGGLGAGVTVTTHPTRAGLVGAASVFTMSCYTNCPTRDASPTQ
jgi:hypothetical protein